MNASAEHVRPFLEVPGNHFRLLQNVYSVTRGNRSQDNAVFILFLSATGVTLGAISALRSPSPLCSALFFEIEEYVGG